MMLSTIEVGTSLNLRPKTTAYEPSLLNIALGESFDLTQNILRNQQVSRQRARTRQ